MATAHSLMTLGGIQLPPIALAWSREMKVLLMSSLGEEQSDHAGKGRSDGEILLEY